MLNYLNIHVDCSFDESWYYFTANAVYIGISANITNDKCVIPTKEKQFLKILLYEFIKKNNFSVTESSYYEGTGIYGGFYPSVIYLNDIFYDVFKEVKNEIHASRKNDYEDVTLEEYVKTLKLGN
jgi:hypothetical protein